MNRQDVEKIITEYLKPIFGFALKRCKSIHDAEDLSQEIATKALRALLAKDDVGDVGKYIWAVRTTHSATITAILPRLQTLCQSTMLPSTSILQMTCGIPTTPKPLFPACTRKSPIFQNCNHCQPCPAGIHIAMVNKFYDLAATQPRVPSSIAEHYRNLEKHASDCIACGGCQQRCPFHVDVMQSMKKAEALFGM